MKEFDYIYHEKVMRDNAAYPDRVKVMRAFCDGCFIDAINKVSGISVKCHMYGLQPLWSFHSHDYTITNDDFDLGI